LPARIDFSREGRVFNNSRRVGVALAAACLAGASVAGAQARTSDSVMVSDVLPGPPRVALVEAANVSIRVKVHALHAVSAALIDSSGRPTRMAYDGIIRAGFSHDTVRIALARGVDAPRILSIGVPAGVTVGLTGSNGGLVRVEGTRAPVEVTHSNGGVTVLDASGYALVATSNGNVDVRLTTVLSGVPMSFITSNGSIDLTLPDDVRATLQIEDAIQLASEFPIMRDRRADQRSGPNLLRLHINGGGPTIRLFTDNGIVRIHRLSAVTH
jgi:hypothetical protein